VLALRRGTFGRRLAALNDSPAACATLGVNINWTKLVVFATSAGLAGFGGVLFAGVTTIRSNNDFVLFLSLVILLLARVGGINTVTGALLGAFVFALFPVLQSHFPQLANLQYLLTGFAAISLGRDPNGLGGRIAEIGERLRGPRSRAAIPVQAGTPGAAAQEAYVEEERLVHAGQ
jgi:branched-chain amino acid transport system permease protein